MQPNPLDQFRLLCQTWGGVGLANVGACLLPRWYGLLLCACGFVMLTYAATKQFRKMHRDLRLAEHAAEEAYKKAKARVDDLASHAGKSGG